jgi:hypothetical protein
MSIRYRKFTYVIETYTDEKYKYIQNLKCRYHIISKCSDELHGFIYLIEAISENTMQRKLGTEYVYSTDDNQYDISNELKINNNYWESGIIPRYVKEKVKPVLIEEVCNTLINQNNKLIDMVFENTTYMKNQIVKLEDRHTILEKAMIEKPVAIQQTMTNSNNDNSKNKKITNINVFLNTECKDAITLKDFVSKLVITDDDLECMKQLGYVESVTRLLKRSLGEYELNERPIHCTDVKREVIHVKDQEGWKKETPLGESPNIDKAFRQLTHIHRKKMSDTYREVHHESNGFEEKAKIMYQIASAGGTEEDKYKKKIIKNITDEIRLTS